MHVSLPKRPINHFKPVQQRRQHVLRAYCPNIYIYILRKNYLLPVQKLSLVQDNDSVEIFLAQEPAEALSVSAGYDMNCMNCADLQ